jgi:hypothetical protein
MIDVEWADPPPPRGGSLTRMEQRTFAAELRSRPGCWAVFPANGGSYVAIRALASRISRGKQAAFGQGYEAISRNGMVYVRYTGGQQ